MTQHDADSVSLAESEGPRRMLDQARRKRRVLLDAMTALEVAAASASRADGWYGSIEEAMNGLLLALEEHIEVVERPDGLLDEVLLAAPRLEVEIEIIRAEHEELLDSWERARRTLEGAKAISLTDPEPIRERVSILLHRLSEHRQRGADLVYEAYNVDIATGD